MPLGESPEGIAISKDGKMYVSNTGAAGTEILQIFPDGSYSSYALIPGVGQLVGLVTDPVGNVYVAYMSADDNVRGIYRVNRNGVVERLAGSQEIGFPNSLTFDARGNLYVTDSYKGPSFEGAVWQFGSDNVFTLWLQDALLNGGFQPGGPPFPLPGANGIIFFPPNKLYVANTMQNSVSRILIGMSGEALSIELVKQDFLLYSIDGLAIDVHENVYGVLPASTLGALGAPPVPPLVMLDPHSGIITPIVMDNSLFDTPTSLVFGTGGTWDRKSVYIANAALPYGQPPNAGPGIVEVYVGAPGMPGK
jgi:sugar lactone lactonase YvrE